MNKKNSSNEKKTIQINMKKAHEQKIVQVQIKKSFK